MKKSPKKKATRSQLKQLLQLAQSRSVYQNGGRIPYAQDGYNVDPQMNFTNTTPEGGWMDTSGGGSTGTGGSNGLGATTQALGMANSLIPNTNPDTGGFDTKGGQTTDDWWQTARSGVAASNPVAAVFHEGSKLTDSVGTAIGTAIGGEGSKEEAQAAKVTGALTDPFGGHVSAWSDDELSTGDKIGRTALDLIAPALGPALYDLFKGDTRSPGPQIPQPHNYTTNPYGNIAQDGMQINNMNAPPHGQENQNSFVNAGGTKVNIEQDEKIISSEGQKPFVVSDHQGFKKLKKGETIANRKVATNPEDVDTTFAKAIELVENSFEGRKDPFSNATKEELINNIVGKNKQFLELKQMKEQHAQQEEQMLSQMQNPGMQMPQGNPQQMMEGLQGMQQGMPVAQDGFDTNNYLPDDLMFVPSDLRDNRLGDAGSSGYAGQAGEKFDALEYLNAMGKNAIDKIAVKQPGTITQTPQSGVNYGWGMNFEDQVTPLDKAFVETPKEYPEKGVPWRNKNPWFDAPRTEGDPAYRASLEFANQTRTNPNPNTPGEFDFTPAVIQNKADARQEDVDATKTSIEKEKTPVTPEQHKLFTAGDWMGTMGGLAPFAYNLARGLQKPEIVDANHNPWENKIRSLMASRRFDPQAVKNDINLQRNAYDRSVANNVSGAGIRNARRLAGFDSAARNMAMAEMEGQKMNNQYRGEESNALNSLGQQRSTEDTRVDIANAMNREKKKEFIGEAMGNVNTIMNTAGTGANSGKYNTQLLAVLDDLYRNYNYQNGRVNFKTT